MKTVGVDTHSSIVIYSKLNKLFYEHFFEQELDEGSITEVELNHLVAKQIKYFTHFIKCCDEIFIKKKKAVSTRSRVITQMSTFNALIQDLKNKVDLNVDDASTCCEFLIDATNDDSLKKSVLALYIIKEKAPQN